MAGHSQFKNIMHRKGAQDAKRAKVFTKIIRELTVAARGGGEPESNPRLRTAIAAARGANMPKDTMERAVKRGAGGEDTTVYEEIRYEGYGPGGVAVIVEALTDNRNRTASEVRFAFSKYGGALGETNSVSFMFDHCGLIVYAADVSDNDTVFEKALEAGAQDVISNEDSHEILCDPSELHQVSKILEDSLGEPQSARFDWRPTTTTELNAEKAETLFKLLDVLQDNDDVQNVTANFEVSDAVLQSLEA
ncbi:MAG: YebC/PmpR family DNA-binding transcriptional regulator [bacterium]|nr:YebC/PmpR family DNA-binding transcriptional regulator [bacterium]